MPNRKQLPINRDLLAAEICLMTEELNRLMALANREGLRVTVEATHMLTSNRINPLPVLRTTVLNRRSR